MLNFEISSIDGIYKIQFEYDKYNKITIDTKKLKYTGSLRYAFKYALWALKIDGELEVIDEPFENFSFSTKRIDFWQIRHEFFKSLKDDIEVIELDDKKGYIKVRKIKEGYVNNGFSFGIVFSGSDSEKEPLAKSIQSIVNNTNLDKYPYEIIICGPSKFDSISYIEQFKNSNIRYLPFDFEPNAKRLMITQKKNYLYKSCKYNITVINHTRILYSKDFMIKTFDKKFDVFTPKVLVEQDSLNHHYLDFGLIGSYDISKKNLKKSITSILFENKYIYFMKNRVPYIDGGLIVINKNILKQNPYDSFVAWGEAEDVMASLLFYSNGLLQDYILTIECFSMTSKYKVLPMKLKSIKMFFRRYFI